MPFKEVETAHNHHASLIWWDYRWSLQAYAPVGHLVVSNGAPGTVLLPAGESVYLFAKKRRLWIWMGVYKPQSVSRSKLFFLKEMHWETWSTWIVSHRTVPSVWNGPWTLCHKTYSWVCFSKNLNFTHSLTLDTFSAPGTGVRRPACIEQTDTHLGNYWM